MPNDFLFRVSQQYGTGDVLVDVCVVILVLSVVAMLFAVIAIGQAAKRNKRLEETLQKFPWGGKLERLERETNEFRTEVRRALEQLRSERAAAPAVTAPLEAPAEPPPAAVEEAPVAPAAPVEAPTPEAAAPAEAPVEAPAPAEEAAAPATVASRLSATRRGLFDRIRAVFSAKPTIDQESVDELRVMLIAADLGPRLVDSLLDEVKQDLTKGQAIGQAQFTTLLKDRLLAILEREAPSEPAIRPVRRDDGPTVVLVVGVNGVGKTTTCAKLAHQFQQQGKKVLLVAADTFRAAAVAQLSEWASRINAPVVTGAEGAKPQTVVFSAMERLKSEEFDVVLIDTAGRLQTKANLMQELEGIRNSIQRFQPSAPHETILVLDGSTGQNALSQAKEFNEAVKLSGVAVTKLDGTPKGGVVVAVKSEYGIPVRYIGVGESVQDLREFNAVEFVDALFSTDESAKTDGLVTAHGETRRRRRSFEAHA